MERNSEMLGELFEAVLRGDIDAAQRKLDEIYFATGYSDAIGEARRRVRPLSTGIKDPSPMALPAAGAKPGDYLA